MQIEREDFGSINKISNKTQYINDKNIEIYRNSYIRS